MPVFIYICFGREDDFYQALFSILSVVKFTSYFQQPDHKMIIYSDNSEFFKKYLGSSKYNIEFHTLTQEKLYELKGGKILQQVFRVKLALIEKTLIETKRNVFYLDADTYFIKDFVSELQISPNESGMCSDEGYIAKRKNQRYAYEVLKKFPQYFSKLDEMKMFNAGLVFVHYQNTKLIQNALKLMDEIYPDFKYYFFEQTLVSYMLGQHTKVKTFDAYIRHYWYLKDYTLVIKDYISKLPEKVLELNSIAEFPSQKVPAEKVYKSFVYQWPIKVMRRLRKWGAY
jgi:hypothetical protein